MTHIIVSTLSYLPSMGRALSLLGLWGPLLLLLLSGGGGGGGGVRLVQANNANNDDNSIPHPFKIPNETTFAANPHATGGGDLSVMNNPLKLTVWSTPAVDDDADNSGSDWLLRLYPLVARFGGAGLISFHPHQALGDGTLAPWHCNAAHALTKLSDECLTNCVNAGRYCALPENSTSSSSSSSGLTGADLVVEQTRRMCLWIVYGPHHNTNNNNHHGNNHGNNNPNHADSNLHVYFDYLQTMRDTRCDEALTDSCVDHVYRTVGVDASEIADCIHNSGGVGPQIESHNALLQEEVHRAQTLGDVDPQVLYTSPDQVLPHVSVGGNTLVNATTLSDWQFLAAVCTALPVPKPPVCDFCLLECPRGNDDHDPTLDCLWNLTCGDDRYFQDWYDGTGVFAMTNGTTTILTTNTNTTEAAIPMTTPESEAGITNTVEKPSRNSTLGSISSNSSLTNTTTPVDNDDDDDKPPHPTLMPVSHHHNQKTMAPEPTAAPSFNTTMSSTNTTAGTGTNETKPGVEDPPKNAPTPAPFYAAGPGYSQHVTPPPHPSSSNSGGSHHQKPSPSNNLGTSASQHSNNNNNNTVGGLLVGILVLGLAVAVVAGIQKYRTGKQYVTIQRHAKRQGGGLATTASHTVNGGEHDLELHVEMAAATTSSRTHRQGYAAPSSTTTSGGAGGVWG